MQNNLKLIDKLNHIKHLFLLGKSDGKLTSSEIKIISEISKKHQLSLMEVSFVLNENHEIPFTLPQKFTDRLTVLYNMVTLMVSDFNIHKKEKEMCLDLARKFEFNPQIIDEMIEDILNFIIDGKDCDQVINYLLKYAHPIQSLN